MPGGGGAGTSHRPPGIALSGAHFEPFSNVTDPLTPPPRDRHIELRNLNHVAQKATERFLISEVRRWRDPEW
jgi:hypothetical protein